METVSITYNLLWQFKPANNYKWSRCGKLINCKTGKLIKKVLNGSIGYWISGEFYSLKKLREQKLIERIKNTETPF